MAAPRITQAERTERELNTDINAAIAGTEQEVADFAFGDEPLDLDGDTSLEEMGEGLEGEHVDDDEEAGQVDGELEVPQQGQQGQQQQGKQQAAVEEPEAGEQQGEQQQVDPRADRGRVPSQALREERQRRQAAEAERNTVLERMQQLERRFDATLTQIATRTQAPPKEPEVVKPPPAPDPFADPDGHREWILSEQRRVVADALKVDREERTREAQADMEQRANDSMARAAQGERGREFNAAYGALMGELKRRGPQDQEGRAFAGHIMRSHDPAAIVLDWFERNGAEDWREQDRQREMDEFARMADRLGYQVPGAPQRGQQQQQPRHEVRLPPSLRRGPPSLNSAVGGGRQQIQDPEMLNDSEESVFDYATRTG